MILVDRYVYDVTRQLPEKQRDDVARELKTEILEMVDGEAKGKKPTKKHEYDVLLRLGRPSQLADSYRDRPRYVIGPEYYESYVELLKTLLVVVLPIIAFLTFTTQLMVSRDSIVVNFIQAAGASFEVGLHIFFWTTAIFFVLDKTLAGTRYREEKEWTPDALPKMPPKQEISRAESYFGIAWSLLAIIATLLQFPAIHQTLQSNVPLFFAPGLWPGWLIGLLVVSVLSLAAEIVKMVAGGWTKLSVLAISFVNVAAAAFFVSAYYLVKPIVNPEFIELIEKTFHAHNATGSFDVGIAIFVAIVVAICVWEIAEAVYKYKKGGKS